MDDSLEIYIYIYISFTKVLDFVLKTKEPWVPRGQPSLIGQSDELE